MTRPIVLACTRGRRWPKCVVCHRPASVQCDARSVSATGVVRTCDAQLCRRCALSDWRKALCPRHAASGEQLGLGLGAGR